ncbi:MAG: 30S ribosomal protein S20 [Pseudomonadota bacterium]
MANIKSAGKRARTAEKRRLANMALRSRMRTYIKKVISDVESGDRDAALASFKAAVPVIDNMAGKGIVHKNKAARHKSRLNKMIKAMGA